MSILVAGSRSFLGRAIISKFSELGIENIISLNRCETESSVCNHLGQYTHCVNKFGISLSPQKELFSTILLLSTVYSRNVKEINKIVQCNIQFLSNILELSDKESGHLIYTNSYMALPTVLSSNSSLYARSKDFFAHLAESYAAAYKLSFDNIYLFDVLGPNDNRKKFLNLAVDAYKKETILNASRGDQILAPISVVDAARILVNQVSSIRNAREQKFLLHGNHSLTLRELVGLTEKIYSLKFPINWGETIADGDHIYKLPTNYENLAKENQEVSLNKTIQSVVGPLIG